MRRKPCRDFLYQRYGDQIRVRINTGSDGRIPLLVCGGFGVPLDVLDAAVATMAETTIIRFDPPGIGGSPNRLLPYRFAHVARLLESLLDELGYAQVDVYGISWGGMVAQEFALNHPRRCRRLILAATMAGMVGIPGNPVLRGLLNPGRWLRKKPRRWMALLAYGGPVGTRDWRKLERQLALYPADLPGYLGQMFAVWGWTSIHRLHRLHQPVLLLYGRDDPIVPMVNARLLEKIIPNARLVALDCGHLFPLTLSHSVCAEISRFRSEQDAEQENRDPDEEKAEVRRVRTKKRAA